VNIGSFVKTVDKLKLRCEGVVVLRQGEKVAEYRWIPEKPRNCFSVSKSFVAVAVGMAVDRGKLSLASRAVEFFPECRKPGKMLSALNLEHLLTMTRGHATFSRPAGVAEAFAQTLTYQPGERFVYDNGSTFLASAMFTRAMGINVRGFLLDELFHPLGIDAPEWAESPDGHTVGATGLMLTTGAMARFGQFLLQRGEWGGKRLVSAEWIDSAGRPHVGTGMRLSDRDLGYGYCFWPCRHGAYRADGKDGQFVVILPRQETVVAINSNESKPYPILDAVWDEILPLL
jgi:CubicO group peptidase (beta-lactamase class C family)